MYCLDFVKVWTAWLNGSSEEGIASNDFICISLQVLMDAIEQLGDNEFLLSGKIPKCLSKKHKMLIMSMLDALEKIEIYYFVKAELPKICCKSNSSTRKICKNCICVDGCATPTNDISCSRGNSEGCCANCLVKKLTCDFYITVFFLSWPYTARPSTNGAQLSKYIENLNISCDLLCDEVHQLRLKFQAILSYIDS